MNPQTALAASIDHARLPGLSRLSTIANSGLSEIQPDASRGRVRYLVLVTDSFSVFLAGKNTGVDLAGVTMLGQPDPKRYQLPHQFDECMKKFFGYARSLGMKTISVSRIADSIPMFDAFHFREDSAQRKRLAEHIGHHMRVLIAEHIAAKVPASCFDEVHRKHPYKDTGKSFIPVIY